MDLRYYHQYYTLPYVTSILHISKTPLHYYRQHVPFSIYKSLSHHPTPTLIFAKLDQAGGFYIRPACNTYSIEDQRIDFNNGCIFIDPESECDTIPHEWRHHWQQMNGWDLSKAKDWKFEHGQDYGQRIREYFNQPHEKDALLFSYHCTDYIFPLWQDTLKIKNVKNNLWTFEGEERKPLDSQLGQIPPTPLRLHFERPGIRRPLN